MQMARPQQGNLGLNRALESPAFLSADSNGGRADSSGRCRHLNATQTSTGSTCARVPACEQTWQRADSGLPSTRAGGEVARRELSRTITFSVTERHDRSREPQGP